MVAIGIDLGTTNSCVAVFQNGTIRIIEDDRGKRIIPSVVTFTKEKILVGFETYVHPESTIYEIKRIIGLKFDNENVKKHMSNSSCKFVNENNQPNYLGAQKQLSPEEISSEILKHLKQIAEKRLDQTITSAVVTVPAYFNGSQRSATKRAAEKAGFLTTRIINEPTAAALSFQYDKETENARKVLVYDFGGGTFDVTIADASKNSFVVLATDGDISLGGTDIDANILEFVKSSIKVDINEKRMLRLKEACKKAKENLSQLSEDEIDMSVCGGDELLTISRQKFEEINKDLFKKTIDIVQNCLSIAKLKPSEINEILLIGGSSRIPKIQEMLRNMFPRSELNSTTNPDEEVARGAAIYAENLKGFDFSDVLSLSLGVPSVGDIMSVIIPRNTRIPCEKTAQYTTSLHNQTVMNIDIRQGESLIASKNQALYYLNIENMKIGKRGETKVNITYKVDREGILSVTAEEVNADNKLELRVELINSAVTEVHEIVENAEVCKDDELKYVKFATRKMEFQEFCEDLKLEHESTESALQHKLFAKIDEALAKSSTMLDQLHEIDKLESELKRFATNNK